MTEKTGRIKVATMRNINLDYLMARTSIQITPNKMSDARLKMNHINAATQNDSI